MVYGIFMSHKLIFSDHCIFICNCTVANSNTMARYFFISFILDITMFFSSTHRFDLINRKCQGPCFRIWLWSRQMPSRKQCTRSTTNLCSQSVTLCLCRVLTTDNKMCKKENGFCGPYIHWGCISLVTWNAWRSESVPRGWGEIELS